MPSIMPKLAGGGFRVLCLWSVSKGWNGELGVN